MARTPEPENLYDDLYGVNPKNLYTPENMAAQLGIEPDVAANLGEDIWGAIPQGDTAMFAEAMAIGNDEFFWSDYDPDEFAGEQGYKKYATRNWAGIGGRPGVYNPRPTDPRLDASAPLSEVPTSTSNPDRPRTVAAGYDPKRETLTVVFRDGTYYNYYGVSLGEWMAFRARGSKWEYIRDVLDRKDRRAASGEPEIPTGTSAEDAEAMRQAAQEERIAAYQVARVGQMQRRGQRTTRSKMDTALYGRTNTSKKYPGTPGVNPNRNKGRRK